MPAIKATTGSTAIVISLGMVLLLLRLPAREQTVSSPTIGFLCLSTGKFLELEDGRDILDVEQDQRAVKRRTHPMLGFKSFWAARCTIAGMEVRHAMRKGQLLSTGNVPR